MADNERFIHVFALRYSLGRMTSAFDLVTDEIVKRYKEFEYWQLEQMGAEILQHVALNKELSESDALHYLAVAGKLKELGEAINDEHNG